MSQLRITTLVSLFAISAAAFGADSTTIVADRDNTLFGPVEDDLASGAGQHLYVGRIGSFGGSNDIRRATVRFDVSGIPSGATIISAEVRVEVVKRPPGAELGVLNTLHRCLGDWGEAASAATGGDGATAQPGDLTWAHRFYPDELWATPGGDFVEVASGEVSVDGPGTYGYRGEGLADDVQAWIDGDANHGWMMIAETSARKTVSKIASRENATPSLRPALLVEYAVAGVPGDLTGDGFVDGADIGALLVGWGPCPGCDADLTGDGVVDGADVGALLVAWTG